MTHGKRIAWISALSVAVVLSLSPSSAATGGRDAQLCTGTYSIAAYAACLRIVSDEQSSVDARTIALRKLVQFATALNQDDLALQHLTALIELGTATSEDWRSRGLIYFSRNQFTQVLADFDRAVALAPGDIENLNYRGVLHYSLGNYPAALADFDTALRISSDDVASLTRRAMVHRAMGNTDKASADVDRALALDGNDRSARLEKSWQLYEGGRPDLALAEIGKVDQGGPPDLTILQLRAFAYLKQGSPAEAVRDAEQAMAMGGDQYDWTYLVRAQARRMTGDFDKALADADVVLKRLPASLEALAERIKSLIYLRRIEAAFADIDKLIETSPNSAALYEIRSGMNFIIGRLDLAEGDARQALGLAPQSGSSLTVLGWTRLYRAAPEDALRHCGAALGSKETDFALRCQAMARLALGQLAAAAADADRALTLDKFEANNHHAAGRVQLARGNPGGAKAHFNEALALHTNDRTAIYMYRGDAERALGNIDQARLDYLEAKKHDLGLYAADLAERLSSIPAP